MIQKKKVIHSARSGFEFLNGYAEWLGIQEKNLSQQPSFWEDKEHGVVKVFNWEEMVEFNKLKDDPAIYPK